MEILLVTILGVLILGPVYIFLNLKKVKKEHNKIGWQRIQEYVTLRIDVPKNNEKHPLAAEQMFAALHGIYSSSSEFQSQMSFEIVAKDKFIQFYVTAPKHIKDFVEGQIYAQYPTVEINVVEDYVKDVDKHNSSYAGCELILTKPDVYPIKCFSDFEVDPLSGITSVMSKLNSMEQVWFQLIIKPVGDDWQDKGNKIVSSVRSGKPIGGPDMRKVLLGGFGKFLKMIAMQAFKPGQEMVDEKAEIKLPASVEEALKGIEQKITKLGFQTKIRIFSVSGDTLTAKVRCQTVAAAFKQFNTNNLNGFTAGEIKENDGEVFDEYSQRYFGDEGSILNITELASVFHFPHKSVETPNIVWSGAKKGEPPANLPLAENTPNEQFTVIGVTNFRNVYREFGIKSDDRRRHIYIVGKSGTGKSTLIENMAINDVVQGRGVIVVDPHGELADKVLSCIPDERVGDVIVFDPADRAYPVAFNLLESVDDDFKGMVASGFVGIFKKIFGDSWGPRLEHILRNTVLALLDYPNSTMLDIPRMLTENRFRDKVVEKVKDSVIRDFWVNEFAQYDAKFRTEAVSPILNKVGQFLATATIRNIVGQANSRINIREIMDNKKILVVNLSRGKIGEDNSALLGAMMITKIQLAAMSRADTAADNRPDTYLYVDEFQNFATDSFAVILSEARKYNLCLTMANQYIEQMQEAVRSAVFGNAGTIITFRVGGTDAAFLVKEFEPVFDANDLVNLDRYTVYLKLLIDGIAPPAFSARTLPPVQKMSGNAETVINLSRKNYSSDRALVEEQIGNRSKEEENELRKEAEVFRQGGLEALLKKNGGESFEPKIVDRTVRAEIVTQSVTKPQERIIAGIKSEENTVFKEEVIQSNDEDQKSEKKEKTRILKYKNIIGDKLYKEQTGKGGIKWYVGEEIALDKYKELGIEVPSAALSMIDLAMKVVTKNDLKLAENRLEIKPVEDVVPLAIEDNVTNPIVEIKEGISNEPMLMESHPSSDLGYIAKDVQVTEIKQELENPVINTNEDKIDDKDDSNSSAVGNSSQPQHIEEGQAVKISE